MEHWGLVWGWIGDGEEDRNHCGPVIVGGMSGDNLRAWRVCHI